MCLESVTEAFKVVGWTAIGCGGLCLLAMQILAVSMMYACSHGDCL